MTPERLTQIRQRQVALRACPYVVCPEPCSAPQCYGTLQYPLCRRPSPADEEVQQLLDALAARDADVQHLLDTCVPEEELAAVTADRNEVERLFKESEHVREDLDAKWEAVQARADRLEQQLAHEVESHRICSQGQQLILDNLNTEVHRRELVEAQLATLKDKLKALNQQWAKETENASSSPSYQEGKRECRSDLDALLAELELKESDIAEKANHES